MEQVQELFNQNKPFAIIKYNMWLNGLRKETEQQKTEILRLTSCERFVVVKRINNGAANFLRENKKYCTKIIEDENGCVYEFNYFSQKFKNNKIRFNMGHDISAKLNGEVIASIRRTNGDTNNKLIYTLLDSLECYTKNSGNGENKTFSRSEIEKALSRAQELKFPKLMELKFLQKILKYNFENIIIEFG